MKRKNDITDGHNKPDVKVNRGYKDRLFRFRFGLEEYKDDVLSVYNALNGTAYDNASDITITTIDDVIYIKMKNDVSLLLDGNLSIWEQQSSINPNMPVRGLMYFGNLYSQYITENGLKIKRRDCRRFPHPNMSFFIMGRKSTVQLRN